MASLVRIMQSINLFQSKGKRKSRKSGGQQCRAWRMWQGRQGGAKKAYILALYGMRQTPSSKDNPVSDWTIPVID